MGSQEKVYKNAVEIAKVLCEQKLHYGDIAIDCTMGNGNDTAFLCELVGDSGKVYAFDIQETAIENTRRLLSDYNLLERAELILDGHQNVDKYVTSKVKFVIFNLGYLPKVDHRVVTKTETTLPAIEKCLNLLQKNGVIILVLYPGHESGTEEKKNIVEYVSNLSQKEYSVSHLHFLNQINNPPELVCIEKVKD
ncbi:class I SAM-dependent methyltransferase [Anaerosporobacter sp.]